MNTFSASEPWRETSQSSGRLSATEFSDALRQRLHALAVFVFTLFAIGACGYAGTPPKPSVAVTVQPTSALVALGATQQFQAAVTGSTDTAVEWDVNGIANGNAISGTASAAGLYTDPAVMPNPASVTVTAISQVNPGDHASAVLTLQSGIGVSVLPATAIVVGAHVVAVDADTGSVIVGTLSGWSCNTAGPPTQFDGSFDLERLPVGHSYNLYAEPLVGLALPGDFSDVFTGLCSSSVEPTCTPPPVNTNFNVRILPASP
jgi:hypothetical protein